MVEIWKRSYAYIERLFDYGTSVRKIMYTTNVLKAVNSNFRKVTKKGVFPNETAQFKLLYLLCLYLCVMELEKSGQPAIFRASRWY